MTPTTHDTDCALAAGETRPPGRPRSERAEKAILEATLDLLVEEAGVAGVTIEAVAARAGVGKTTIYRRWPNKEQLIIDAMASLKAPVPVARGRSFREDLLEMMESLRPGNDPRAEWLWNIFGGATKHPALARQYQRQVIEPRREALRDLFRRGIESGDLSPDTDIEVSISMVVGAIHMRARSHDPDDKLPPDFVKRLLQTLLTGIEAR